MRRYQIVLTDADGTVTAAARRLPDPVPVGTDAERWRGRLDAGHPLMMATLESRSFARIPGTPADQVAWLTERYPFVDAWMLGHFNKHEEQVRLLRAAGRMVVRRIDMLSARSEARAARVGDWERSLIDCMDAHEFQLRDAKGAVLHYRWWGKGEMADWSAAGPEGLRCALAGGGFFGEPAQQGNVWEFDQAFRSLREWMLLRGVSAGGDITQETLETLYSRDAYRQAVVEFITNHLAARGGIGYLNGDDGWEADGFYVMWEAANVRHLDEFADILERWAKTRGNVLEIRSPEPTSSPEQREAAMTAIARWARDGGVLWPDNPWHPLSDAYPEGELTELQAEAVRARG